MSVTAPTYLNPPITQDPGSLYDGFTAFMQAQIPGWKPFSAELDDFLARGFAGIAAQLMEITSDVATSIFRYFGAYIMGFPPYAAIPAVGSVTITVIDTAGYTIPAFTAMSFPDESGNLQGFETTTDTVIAPSTSTASVNVQAMVPGAAANGCSGSGDLDASTPITYIAALSMAASSGNGSDAEEDVDYLGRLVGLMQLVSPAPITSDDFSSIAETQPGVGAALTIGAFNPASWTMSATAATSGLSSLTVSAGAAANVPVGAPIAGTGLQSGTFVTSVGSTSIGLSKTTSGTVSSVTITGQLNQGGYVTTWVRDSNGAALGSTPMSAIQSAIQAMCLANVIYTVVAPTYTSVDVTAAVVAWPGSDTTALQTTVEASITRYLEPTGFNQFAQLTQQPDTDWVNETVVRGSALQAVIMGAGVHYIGSLTINGSSADLPLAGVVPLPTPGTVTVTVTTG